MNSTILLVDDDEGMLQMFTLILERKGFAVLRTTDPRAALNILNTAPPDLVISDLMMPDLNGRELCEQIRLRPEHAALPVLIVSAKHDQPTIEACLQAGATEYLAKPVTPQNLISTVHRLLDVRPASSQA